MSEDALGRHRSCIRDLLRSADQKRGSNLLQRVNRLADKLERMADECEAEMRAPLDLTDAPGLKAAILQRVHQASLFLQSARELRPTFMLMGQLNGEIASASVDAFLRALGVTDQAEVRTALDMRRSMALASVEDVEQEVLTAMRFLLAERPQFRAEAMAVLESDAPKMLTNGNGTNGGSHD